MPDSVQELLLAELRVHSGRAKGAYGMPGIELRSAVYKGSALLAVLLFQTIMKHY